MDITEINGEARLSLKDLGNLLKQVEEAKRNAEAIANHKRDALEMMMELLQFIGTKDYFKDIKAEFNASHDRLAIDRDPKSKRIILKIDGQKLQRKDS